MYRMMMERREKGKEGDDALNARVEVGAEVFTTCSRRRRKGRWTTLCPFTFLFPVQSSHHVGIAYSRGSVAMGKLIGIMHLFQADPAERVQNRRRPLILVP
jgi:hypothetical protein